MAKKKVVHLYNYDYDAMEREIDGIFQQAVRRFTDHAGDKAMQHLVRPRPRWNDLEVLLGEVLMLSYRDEANGITITATVDELAFSQVSGSIGLDLSIATLIDDGKNANRDVVTRRVFSHNDITRRSCSAEILSYVLDMIESAVHKAYSDAFYVAF